MIPRFAFVCLLIWIVAIAAIALAGPDRLETLVAELRQEIRELRAENATLRKRLGMDVTRPRPRPPASVNPWKCETCKRPMRLDNDVKPHHIAGQQDHPARLSREDLRTLADGLRMRD